MIRISIINILFLVGLLIGCTSINKDVDIAIVTRTQLGIAYLFISRELSSSILSF